MARKGGFGARSISELMRKHWRFEPSRSPGAISAMHQSCPTCSARSRQARRSAASPLKALMILASAMTRSLTAAPCRHTAIPPPQEREGRAIWRNWSGNHRRSRVETKMHCLKLLGQRLMARDFERQVAEVKIRIAVMIGYTALGIPVTETAG
jgi:hypothetical protein